MGHIHQGRHLIVNIPVFDRTGTVGLVLRDAALVDLSGVRVVILEFLHVPQRDRVTQLCPVGIRFRVAVVIGGINGGNVVSSRLIELGQVPVQHRQFVQYKRFHAVKLGVIRQKTVFAPLGPLHQQVQVLLVVPPSIVSPVPILGDEFLDRGDAAIDPAAHRHATLGRHSVDGLLRQSLIRTPEGTHLEIPGVCQDEVRYHLVGEILLHTEAIGEGDGQIQQHHRQGERQHCHHRLAAAAAQVGLCHGEQGHAARLLHLLFQRPALGVPHRLNGTDLRRQTTRPGAGQQHRQQRKQRGDHENDRAGRHHVVDAVESGNDDRRQPGADEPPNQQAKRNAHQREEQRLLADDVLELPSGGADGFQQSIEADIVGDGDLEHIVDNEIAGEDDEQQHGGDAQHHAGVQTVRQLGAGVAPVDAGGDVVVPVGAALGLIAVV